MMRLLFLLVCFVAPSLAATAQGPAQNGQPWSVRMAEAVMKRRPIIRERWDYETGTVLRGFEELWHEVGDDRYLAYIQSNVDEYVLPDGSIRTYRFEDFNIDNINTGALLILLDAETDDPRYRAAADLLRRQLAEQPRTSEGGYWHKHRYPYQIWLDGLYMAEPFALRYSLAWTPESEREEELDDIALQFLLAARYLRDPATGLFYHGWDETRSMLWANAQTGRSANFWGRAMGWYAMGLVDVLGRFPQDHPDRPALLQTFRQLAAAIENVQDPVSGVWYQILDQPTRSGNYLEASASSMFVYAILKGVRLGLLDANTYRPAGVRGFRGLLHEFVRADDEGLLSLTQIVSVAGLGGDNDRDGSYEYYLSEPVVADDPKGLGPFILASLEFEQLRLPSY